MMQIAQSTNRKAKIALAQAYEAKVRRVAEDASRPSLYLWTIRHRRMLREGVAFDTRRHLYLTDLFQCTAKHMVIYKASQLGASEYAVSRAIFACDAMDATVLYIFPQGPNVTDFSAARIGPAIEASEYLSSIVKGAGSDVRGADRVTLKRFRNRFLYLRHANVSVAGMAPQLKSVDADLIILDEVDEMDPRAIDIARKRLGHSQLNEELHISTPTFPNRGIHAAYKPSDQREWYVRCDGCNHWQTMTIKHVVVEWDSLERPVAWHGMNEGRAYVACERCGRELDRLQRGAWVPRHPGREIVGFHLTKLFSPTADPLRIVQTLQSVDETERRECFNQDLGLPYKPRGGSLDRDTLDALKRDYGHGPQSDIRPFAGIDVGKLLHVVIRAPASSSGERRQLFAGDVLSFEEVLRLLRIYRVKSFVIDGLPETRKARELIDAYTEGQGWAAFYSALDKKESSVIWNEAEHTVTADRTRILDEMFAGFYDRATNVLPAHIEGVKDYYDHLQSPVRILEKDGKGGERATYVESGPDHFAHAETYCLIASKQAPVRTSHEVHVVSASQLGLS